LSKTQTEFFFIEKPDLKLDDGFCECADQKPRAAQIAPMELRGEKEDTTIKSVLNSWEEEERNFAVIQLKDSR
jgi:hypothetical protein